MLMIRAFHDALDLQLVYDDIWKSFYIRIAGVKNILFVFRIEAELFQIILTIKESDDKIALICGLLAFHKNIISGEDARADHAFALGDQGKASRAYGSSQ